MPLTGHTAESRSTPISGTLQSWLYTHAIDTFGPLLGGQGCTTFKRGILSCFDQYIEVYM
jgi:hypothetical protein